MSGRQRKQDRFETEQRRDKVDLLVTKERFESAEWDAMVRKNLQMGYMGAFDLDLTNKPSDVDYLFVAEYVAGEYNPNRLRQVKRFGWTPVPSSRHPEVEIDDLIDERDSKRDGIVRSSGQILFERPKKYGVMEQDISRKQNLEDLRTIPGLHDFGDKDIPFGVRSNQVYTTGAKKSFN